MFKEIIDCEQSVIFFKVTGAGCVSGKQWVHIAKPQAARDEGISQFGCKPVWLKAFLGIYDHSTENILAV